MQINKLDNNTMAAFLTEAMIKAVSVNDMEVFYTSLDESVSGFLETDDYEIDIHERQENVWVVFVTMGDESKQYMINKLF